jgi:predicted SAM-dependent methyltransferase
MVTEAPAANPLKLHIGGQIRSPGWTVLNAQPGPNVDIVANCLDLSDDDSRVRLGTVLISLNVIARRP